MEEAPFTKPGAGNFETSEDAQRCVKRRRNNHRVITGGLNVDALNAYIP